MQKLKINLTTVDIGVLYNKGRRKKTLKTVYGHIYAHLVNIRDANERHQFLVHTGHFSEKIVKALHLALLQVVRWKFLRYYSIMDL